jgi:hypothetical protein
VALLVGVLPTQTFNCDFNLSSSEFVNINSLNSSVVNVDSRSFCSHPSLGNSSTIYPESGLSVYYTNATSLNNKIDELRALVAANRFSAVFITETWADSSSALCIDGYTMYRKDRTHKRNGKNMRGGGVCVYVRNDITGGETSYNLNEHDDDEMIWLELKACEDKILVGCIYKSPECNIVHVNKALQKVRHALDSKMFTGCLIVGDFNLFNISWGSCGTAFMKRDDLESESFISTIRDSFLFQHVFEPTFQTQLGELTNTLDLVLTDMPERIYSIKLGPPLGQLTKCHLSLTFNFAVARRSEIIRTGRKFCYAKADYDGLNKYFEKQQWSYILKTDSDINACYAKFIEKYDEGCKLFIKSVDLTVVSRWPSWFSSELKCAIRAKKKLWFILKKNHFKSEILKIKFRCKAVEVNKLIKKCTFEYERKLALQAKFNPKLIYSYLNNKRLINTGISSLKISGTDILTDNKNIMADLLNKEFQSSFSVETGFDSELVFENRTETKCDDDPETIFNLGAILKKLKSLEKYKSAGIDGVHSHVLNSCSDSLAFPLMLIFKKSLFDGKLPRVWKSANITPIFKKGAKCDPANYRPISLTSVVCRVAESLIKDTVENFLLTNNLIAVEQHGFLPRKSCSTNLLETFDIITASLEHGLPVDILFTDFSSAFNKVSHRQLVDLKLPAYGIQGRLLLWIKDFLSDRFQRVVLGQVASDWLEVTSGVPQGSVLGPLLFIVFINDLIINIHSFPKLFADDTKLIGIIKDETSVAIIQNDLDIVSQWCKTWLM